MRRGVLINMASVFPNGTLSGDLCQLIPNNSDKCSLGSFSPLPGGTTENCRRADIEGLREGECKCLSSVMVLSYKPLEHS